MTAARFLPDVLVPPSSIPHSDSNVIVVVNSIST